MIKNSKLILLLAAILLVSLVFTGCKWGKKDPVDTDNNQGVLTPDYPLPPVDPGAEDIVGDQDTEKLESENGGGAVGLVYKATAEVNLSTGKVTFMFGNPIRSNQNIVVSIAIPDSNQNDYIIARSGILEPGKQVTKLDLSEDARTKLTQAGVYDGKYLIDNYNPLTGEKAVVDIQIPIKITVK